MRKSSVLFLLQHYQTCSTYVVEFHRVNGRVEKRSSGFVCGNVVDLSAYRRVLTVAMERV